MSKQKKPTEEAFPPHFGDIKIDEARGVLEQLRRQTDEMIEKVRLETNFKEN